MATTKLSEAIDAYRSDAGSDFDTARDSLRHPPAPPPAESAEDAKKRSQADEVKRRLQSQVSGAFAQLSTAETMQAAQRGRDGYDKVVEVMERTSTTTKKLCDTLESLAGQAPSTLNVAMINALANALQALAQVSPTSFFQNAANPTSTTPA